MSLYTALLAFLALNPGERQLVKEYVLSGDPGPAVRQMRLLTSTCDSRRCLVLTGDWRYTRRPPSAQEWLDLGRLLRHEAHRLRFGFLITLTAKARREFFPGVPPSRSH